MSSEKMQGSTRRKRLRLRWCKVTISQCLDLEGDRRPGARAMLRYSKIFGQACFFAKPICHPYNAANIAPTKAPGICPIAPPIDAPPMVITTMRSALSQKCSGVG
jgi:hypothetical protein